MSFKSKLFLIGTGIFSTFTIVLFHNCSYAPIKHQSFPPIGEKVLLPSVQPDIEFKTDNDYKHVLIYFSVGSLSLFSDDKTMVQFINSNDGSILSEYSAQELKDMHMTTECPNEVISFLENTYIHESLFCNNSIDLSQVKEFQVVREGEPTKVATSYSVKYSRNELDMIVLTVNAN